MGLETEKCPYGGGTTSRLCWRSPLGGSSVTVPGSTLGAVAVVGSQGLIWPAEMLEEKPVSGKTPACGVGGLGKKNNPKTCPYL